MKVSAEYAQAHIADLLALASEGEAVEIFLPDKPSLKLVVMEHCAEDSQARALDAHIPRTAFDEWKDIGPIWRSPERPRSELFGSLIGKMEMSPDWDSDETNAEIARQFEGAEDSFEDRAV
jgi:antitoxin (DNA-binding transcriptional repressor) of toxin-antitoxin stability system